MCVIAKSNCLQRVNCINAIMTLIWRSIKCWACSQENESRSERRFGTWFGPFLIWKPNFTLCECKALSNLAFETRFETPKKAVLDRDSSRKPDSRTCERKALSERDSCVCILEMRAEAMHGSISVDCAVGTKYYLAVRRSWSWLWRRLKCMWTHVVQITIPNTKRIAIWNVFQNVIRSFVNTAAILPVHNVLVSVEVTSMGPFIYVLGTDTRCICSRNKFSVNMHSDYEINELFLVP